jgi:hypothetical protein
MADNIKINLSNDEYEKYTTLAQQKGKTLEMVVAELLEKWYTNRNKRPGGLGTIPTTRGDY